MIVSPTFSGKTYAVLGLARSGLAAAECLLASGADVVAWDKRDDARAKLAGRAEIGDPLEIDLRGFDGIVVSPGVPLNTHPIAARAATFGVPVIGDIELFAQARADLPPHKVVGITGTNGKSTTTALVHHILKTAGVPATMGGNIGLPILGQEPLPQGGVYVLELSSYQIDITQHLDCDVAVLLNITPDHLDRYEGFPAYVASKARLFAMQSAENAAIIAGDDNETRLIATQEWLRRPQHPNWWLVHAEQAQGQAQWPSLQGPHNAQNAVAASAAARALGVSDHVIEQGLRTYPGLPHRMELLGTYGGVLFVNDSKATNPASTAPALAAWPPNPDKRVHWICGGLPKSDDLDECAPYFGNIAAAYTIGEAGPRFAELLEPHMHVERCEMLCEATSRAHAVAKPGDVVLFSPACASFDQFRDYEARGDAFREIVAVLTGGVGAQDRQACVGSSAA